MKSPDVVASTCGNYSATYDAETNTFTLFDPGGSIGSLAIDDLSVGCGELGRNHSYKLERRRAGLIYKLTIIRTTKQEELLEVVFDRLFDTLTVLFNWRCRSE